MPEDAKAGKIAAIKEIYDWLGTVVFAVVTVVLAFTFLCRTVGVDGSSMEPTLQNEDRLVISHLFYEPQPGDVVVITQPNSADVPIVKRIIADEGQSVMIDFKEGVVSVDGVVLDEPYISEATHLRRDVQFPVTVPQGCVFVLGDNRNHSLDSRDSGVGMIDKRYILGKVIFRLFPFRSIGTLS
ncbi:MAG: signal peptidase I [Oscillospiraceae bacterium]|nr:signal peptidase I [Oscillospiraceae bacterium]